VEFINNFSEYTKLLNSIRFLEWFDCKVSNATFNLMQWFEIFYSQKDKAHWTMEVMELWDKVAWQAKFSKNISKKEGVVGTVDGKRGSKPFFPNWRPKHFVDSKHNNCVAFVG
jgi:hypothetical protein